MTVYIVSYCTLHIAWKAFSLRICPTCKAVRFMTEQSSSLIADSLIPDVCIDKTRESKENNPKLFPNKNSLLLKP